MAAFVNVLCSVSAFFIEISVEGVSGLRRDDGIGQDGVVRCGDHAVFQRHGVRLCRPLGINGNVVCRHGRKSIGRRKGVVVGKPTAEDITGPGRVGRCVDFMPEIFRDRTCGTSSVGNEGDGVVIDRKVCFVLSVARRPDRDHDGRGRFGQAGTHPTGKGIAFFSRADKGELLTFYRKTCRVCRSNASAV